MPSQASRVVDERERASRGDDDETTAAVAEAALTSRERDELTLDKLKQQLSAGDSIAAPLGEHGAPSATGA